jgi:hypothetical protein
MAINRVKHARRKGKPVRPDEDPSPAQVDVFFRVFAEDLSEYDARTQSKISRAQLARLKADPAFLARYDDMKEDLLDRVEHAAYRQAIVRGDKDLIKMLLVAKRQADYAPRASLNLNVDVTKLTDEELDELITKHSKRSG